LLCSFRIHTILKKENVMPKLSEMLFGKKERIDQLPLFTPEQQEYFKMLLEGSKPGVESGMDYLTQLLSGEEGAFDTFAAPLRREFEEQTVPNLAAMFAGKGGGLGSSGFAQSLSSAGAGLTENLAALRENLKMQAISGLRGFGQMGLGQQFESMLRPGTGGLFGSGGSFGLGETIDTATKIAGLF
jgi:hypothetical protein